ncbi:MAG: hypothetical protein QOF45_1617 [Gaiellaceae bacterium]|jgi:hypothetical protein|nr:hypothetical protein [Gaiellaceae bacterium]
MIRSASALCVLLALAVAGAAHAHDSGPAIAKALVALRQGPISVDPSGPVSEQQAAAISRRLDRSTRISVAILPVDFSLSAVGAAREIEAHLARPGTVVALLGGDLGATSTDVGGQLLGALVRESQAVYNREGAVPALVGLIDRIEAAKRPGGNGDHGRGWTVALVIVAAGATASVLALLALRRGARRP